MRWPTPLPPVNGSIEVPGSDMDCCMASSPVQDIAMSSSTSHQSFVSGGSQESISMQYSATSGPSEIEGNVSDSVEGRRDRERDSILPTPLAVKIADLGNACWVVSCGHFESFSVFLKVCIMLQW